MPAAQAELDHAAVVLRVDHAAAALPARRRWTGAAARSFRVRGDAPAANRASPTSADRRSKGCSGSGSVMILPQVSIRIPMLDHAAFRARRGNGLLVGSVLHGRTAPAFREAVAGRRRSATARLEPGCAGPLRRLHSGPGVTRSIARQARDGLAVAAVAALIAHLAFPACPGRPPVRSRLPPDRRRSSADEASSSAGPSATPLASSIDPETVDSRVRKCERRGLGHERKRPPRNGVVRHSRAPRPAGPRGARGSRSQKGDAS